MKRDGGWVFISHSHLDIELVRKIRNYLEAKGFEPLMFFLKCLTDDDEIEDLIRREIDIRDWFIYVDSYNSRNSRWVQSERDYIRTLEGKKIFTIDLSKDITDQLEKISRQLQVFISYSVEDRDLAGKIADRLVDKDFLVLSDLDFRCDESIDQQGDNALLKSAHEGFIVLLVTNNSCDSPRLEHEIRVAAGHGGKIVPVYVGDAKLGDKLLDLVGDIQGVHIQSVPTKEELQELVDDIINRVDYYNSDFTMSIGFQSAVSIQYPHIGRIEDYAFIDCYRLEEVTIPAAVQYISEKAFREDQDVLIKCEKGSYAEQFCKDHNMRYEIIG